MKIGIYHPFGELVENYSLSNVVIEQMQMVIENGHECHFLTATWFKGGAPEGVIIHPILDNKNKDNLASALDPIISTLDAVLTHDVAYLGSYQVHADAIRVLSERYPKVKWFHWCHSAPNPGEKKKPIPNSTYIGMNYTDLQLLADQFQVPIGSCRVVYNSVTSDNFFGWHPFTKQIVDKHKLMDCDILVVYPLDSGRFEAKGGFKIIKLIKALQNQKILDHPCNAKVVFVNAAANDKARTEMVEGWGKQFNQYAIFTSLEDKQYAVYAPRRVVRELMQLGNLFPLFSISEGCSLTFLEAALCGNLVMINEDFPPMTEFANVDEAYRVKVSSTRQTTNYNPNEESYYNDLARMLVAHFEKDKAHRLKRKVIQRFNRAWIWVNMLEPLLK